MKNILKTTTMILLVLAMLLSVVACGGETETTAKSEETTTKNATGETTEETTEEVLETDEWGQTILKNSIPEGKTFGGEEIDICIRSSEQYRREWCKEEVEDSLDNEIYKRNLAVEEELDVTLNYIVKDEGNECETINNFIINSGKSGLGDVDIVSNYAAFASNPTLMQYYTNFNSDKLTYLDLDKPWWNSHFRQAAEAYGKLFVMVGDVNLSVYDRTIVTWFNQTQCANYDISAEDIYADVIAGTWTYEKLYSYTKDVYQDLNHNETKDSADFFGLCSIRGSEATDGFLYSFDCYLTETDADGNHTLVSGTTLSKMDTAMTKLHALFDADGATTVTTSMENYKVFTESRALFDIDVIYHYASGNSMMRDMDDVYGMIPVPKYDEEQEDYLSGVQDAHNVMSIIYHAKQNFEAVSAVLELMCYKTYYEVRPYYFEKMVKTRYLKDEASGQIFDMLLESTTWDFADVYAQNLSKPRNSIWRSPFQKNTTVISAYETEQEKINLAYEEFDTWLRTHY